MSARSKSSRALFALAALATLGASRAEGWLIPGHRRITADAISSLRDSVPAWVRDGAEVAAAASADPDLWRNDGTPALDAGESPEHFLDLELLRGAAFPERRSDYLRLLAKLGVDPSDVGSVPYAVVEGAERLALSFAQHRAAPANEALRTKCLIQVGWLSHFAGDLTQPLHTTVHHDGRVGKDGRSPRSGIHRKVDALLSSGSFGMPRGAPPRLEGALWAAVRRELDASHALVDEVYAIESMLASRSAAKPGSKGEAKLDARVARFAEGRYGAATRFVAGLIRWSWERSAALELPGSGG